MPLGAGQPYQKPSIQQQIAHIVTMGPHSTYDPVPPYDMDELESTAPPTSNDQLSIDTTIAHSEATERPNDHHQQESHQQNHLEYAQNVDYCTKCNRKFGGLTHQQSCRYGVIYVVLVLITIMVCTSLVVSGFRR